MAKGIKTGGRTKGTPNKLTSEIKETLKDVLSNEIENLPHRLSELDVKDRLDVLVKLIPYILPKENEQMNFEQKQTIILKDIDDTEPKKVEFEIIQPKWQFVDGTELKIDDNGANEN